MFLSKSNPINCFDSEAISTAQIINISCRG